MTKSKIAVFDRDGTIIVEKNYLADPTQVELLPASADGLRALQAAGYRLIVITNQSGIGRGYFSLREYERVTARFTELLGAEKIHLAGIYFCPHTPEENCECRKPRGGLIYQAARELNFSPNDCVVVGDKAADINLGKTVGARLTVLVNSGYGADPSTRAACAPDYIVADLAQAAEVILAPAAPYRRDYRRRVLK